jgi:hypothetical protein
LAVSSAHNFSEHVFSWYVKQGKQGRLLLATGRSNELGRFVQLFLCQLEVHKQLVDSSVVYKLSLTWVGWIWIWIQVGKNEPHQNDKKVKKCAVLQCLMFSFEG